jgi:hypothetical protein
VVSQNVTLQLLLVILLEKVNNKCHMGGGGGSKKCHISFEWPHITCCLSKNLVYLYHLFLISIIYIRSPFPVHLCELLRLCVHYLLFLEIEILLLTYNRGKKCTKVDLKLAVHLKLILNCLQKAHQIISGICWSR